MHFQYVFVPLLLKEAFLGTCVRINKKRSRSTEDDMEFNSIKNFIGVVKIPNAPNNRGSTIEIIIKGASVMMIYLALGISSSVITNAPTHVNPI